MKSPVETRHATTTEETRVRPWIVGVFTAALLVTGLMLAHRDSPVKPPAVIPPAVVPRHPVERSSVMDPLPDVTETESTATSGSGTTTAGTTVAVGSPLSMLIDDMLASRDRDLAPSFIAQVESIRRAGVDPVLLAHAVARQFNRQAQVRLTAAGTFSPETYQQEATAGAREWITRLLGETTYNQWLAEKNNPAPPATLTAQFVEDLTGKLRSLQSNGVDEVLLRQILNSQNGRLDSLTNRALYMNPIEVLGQTAQVRFSLQEDFRSRTDVMQSLPSEKLTAYATLYQGYQDQVNRVQQELRNGARTMEEYRAEQQRLMQDYRDQKQQLLGPDLAANLP